MSKTSSSGLSKTKLALLVFCVAFGVNVAAFIFSKKSFLIQETKTVWLYELPPTLNPLDAYASRGIGPHQGVIGTMFFPRLDAQPETEALQTMLADPWSWDDRNKILKWSIRPGATYGDGTPILAEHWVRSLVWAQGQAQSLAVTPEWKAFLSMKVESTGSLELSAQLASVPTGFSFLTFAKEVLSHPITGAFHPDNLKQLEQPLVPGVAYAKQLTSGWITSGPYRVRKWKPKEITLVSRDEFPVQLPKEFFRTLRYQSAPVKNPACDFMQANALESNRLPDGGIRPKDRDLDEHSVWTTGDEVHVFWICRSWKQVGSFCSDPEQRRILAQVLSPSAGGEGAGAANSAGSLAGKKLKFRIPLGSDGFRQEFRDVLVQKIQAAGAIPEEVSFFFKESKDADLELGFSVVTQSAQSAVLAERLMALSSRLGGASGKEPHLVGEISRFPLMILLKRMRAADPFKKVFLEPDLDEKKLPL
jgi:hypothetical protein